MYQPRMIASPVLSGGPNVYAEVAGVICRYLDTTTEPMDGAALAEILDPAWNGKREADGVLVVETRDKLFARNAEKKSNSVRRADFNLTSVQVFFDDFAVGRADAWGENAAVTIFTLFKTKDGWRIATEASCGREIGSREKQFNPLTAEADVLKVLDVYYRAVEEGTPEALADIFDSGWHMKNLENGGLYSETTVPFAARLEKPWKGYFDDRQVSDVQIVSNRLATVRVDKPSSKSVVMFTFFRLAGGWKIVDKAWSFAG